MSPASPTVEAGRGDEQFKVRAVMFNRLNQHSMRTGYGFLTNPHAFRRRA
jgi:hypothetical protein